ncbi:hypothetical protein M5689_002348 [Euphorbia peplus]|nr:hypothetical protein M5689_002348 [Euphorbia peplus]
MKAAELTLTLIFLHMVLFRAMNATAAASSLLLTLIFNFSSHIATGISPQVSPSPSTQPEPIVTVTDERCSDSSNRTCRDRKSLTACLNTSSSSNSFKDVFLLVRNDGDEPLKANVAIVDINVKLPDIILSKHQAKKIKISANIDGSPAIILDAGNGKCIILVRSPELNNASHEKYLAYLSPMYGAYFLFFSVLIAIGAWACCKFGKNEEQIGYQGLEMEQPATLSAKNDEEMAAGWNRGWGGNNWEEEAEEVKSPNEHGIENAAAANGNISKASDPDGWEKDWEI